MPIEIDPTESDQLRDRQTQFSQLSTDVQTMLREMLDDGDLSNIVIHDGESNHITVWGNAGQWAGQTAETLVNHGFSLQIYQRFGSEIELNASRVGENNEH